MGSKTALLDWHILTKKIKYDVKTYKLRELQNELQLITAVKNNYPDFDCAYNCLNTPEKG